MLKFTLMNSKVYSRKNYFFSYNDIEYYLDFEIPADNILFTKFIWSLLHKVLPREVRKGDILLNIKGLRFNNVLQDGLAKPNCDYENLIFYTSGKTCIDENLPENQECLYAITTDFYGFLNRKNIQYQAKILQHEEISKLFDTPVYEYIDKFKLDTFFMGLEFFEPHFFSYIGFAPRITRSLLIQNEKNIMHLRFKADRLKNVNNFFSQFFDVGHKIKNLIYDIYKLDIENDFLKQLS